MATPDLGRLDRVDLHEVWATEAADFTPWLAEPDNLKILADTIGLELELETQEKNVGPFRADLFCKETLSNNWVLIENQLERTDHTHLGQLLTYAAGLDAVTVVWIAARFTEEHRAALDWLNDNTHEDVNFFGLEVELWRIGDSPVAPRFNIVSKPNEWTKPPPPRSVPLTDTRQTYLRYWTAFRQYLEDQNSSLRSQKPLPASWTSFAVGRNYFQLAAVVNSLDKWIAAELDLGGPDAKPHFHLLMKEKDSIESNLQTTAQGWLEWQEMPGKKMSRIRVRLRNVNPLDEKDWPRQHRWLQERLEAFHGVFAPRVRELDASEYYHEEGESAVD